MSELQEKIKQAEQTLRLAAQMSEYYYHQPLIVCYSGGKDSDVILNIAKRCLNADQFEVVNSHTTVDAPETVYHIRKVFKELEAQGIKTKVIMPKYKGKPISMWRLIEQKLMPPTRIVRYCCEVLKETTTPNRMVAVGVREDESTARQGRDAFIVKEQKKSDAEFRSLQHTYAMFKLDKTGKEDAYECKMIEACKKHKDTMCNPIYKFNESDIWQYIRENGIEVNPLYAKGYKRVGCVGCPLGGCNSMKREFRDYPKYAANYIKAFDRMILSRKAKGLKTEWASGEEVMQWWLGENPKQIRIDELLAEVKENEQ